MIITALLLAIYGVVWTLTRVFVLFAPVSLDNEFATALQTAQNYIGTFDKFLPVDTIYHVVGLVMAIELILAGYKLVMWIIRRIPTQS